ncbi:MAG: aminoacyl-tRNA hydrolase [Bacteroidales bacterium]|nr:aminoacyl-tRNA hydrolase [Bacteroidales bacterium]
MGKNDESKLPAIAGRDFSGEWIITASKSRGPGGQNVNKVNTKVELRFHPLSSQLLTNSEKELVMQRLKKKLTENGFLIIISRNERSQLKNKKAVAEKFYYLINKALTPRKARKPTKRTVSSIEKRLNVKRIKADKKVLRKKPVV